jgi:membrane protease YdiL (CAAX protease family)
VRRRALTDPLIVAAVLFALSLVSPLLLPGLVTTDDRVALLFFGPAWGLMGGGLLEELGCTGFVLPRLRVRFGALALRGPPVRSMALPHRVLHKPRFARPAR